MPQSHYLVVLYKSGAKCFFPPEKLPPFKHCLTKRGIIGSASRRTLIRGAWTLGQMPRDWGVMITLTHRLIPTDVKQALKKFLRAWRTKLGKEIQWAWFMEFQKRGAVHFHFFVERAYLENNGLLNALETIHRRKCKLPVTIVRGGFDRFVVEEWLQATGDKTVKARAFNEGGIVELLRNVDGAGRYMASYVGKEDQKTLPDGCAPCGRWWSYNPLFPPKAEGRKILKYWPFPFRYKHVFNKSDLDSLLMLQAENVPHIEPDFVTPECEQREYVLNNVTRLYKGVAPVQKTLKLWAKPQMKGGD